MRYALFYLFLMLTLQCKTKKEVVTDPPKTKDPIEKTIACTTHAIVEDHTGLDGCRLLLRLDNGKKWLPSNSNDPKYKLEKNDEIYFGYRLVEDGISVCMAEDKIVELTCLQVIGKTGGIKPGKAPCIDTTKPMHTEWLRKKVEEHQPRQIVKYPFRKNDWAYLYKTKTSRILYDCQGYLVCEAKNGDENDCVDTYLQYLRDGKIVFQDEGPGN